MSNQSVLPEYVGAQVVSGQSAVGEVPAANPVSVAGVDGGGLKRAIRTDADGRTIIGSLPVLTQTGALTSINSELTIAVPEGYKTCEAWLTDGNLSASVVISFSMNGGVSYSVSSFSTAKRLDTASAINGLVLTGANVADKVMRVSLPAAVTHVKLMLSSYTSGSSNAVIAISGDAYTQQVTADCVLSSSTARAGFIARPGVWTRESTTPVNAALSITGAAKTTYNTATGVAFNTATSYGDKFCAAAGADVAGTLIIDASPDSGTTWYPVASIALTQVGGSGNFGAYLEVAICEATMRGRLVNGVINQSRAYLTTRMLG